MAGKVSEKLASIKIDKPGSGSLWKGPEVDGITYSLLSRFLVCRERFRIHVIEGLRPAETFNHRLEFGSMWHLCEEAISGANEAGIDLSPALYQMPLQNYAKSLCQKYPTQQGDIENWYGICKAMFPLYVRYWSQHPDMVNRTPLLSEQVFDVPYSLPSGRRVRLRGKWDSVDLVGPSTPRGKQSGEGAGIWLQENKTKSDINERQIMRQLSFDLQTMLYLVALEEKRSRLDDSTVKNRLTYRDKEHRVQYPLRGVRYNVIRRPRQYQGKKESRDQFLNRLSGIIQESPGEFFMRWTVGITPGDIKNFRAKCLDPILEQLYDWWDHVSGAVNPFNCRAGDRDYMIHWQHPFGVRNILDEGGMTDLDEYLATGSTVGLVRSENLFPEL